MQKNNVKVIFCGEKNNPQTELVAYYGAHNTSKRYKKQLLWTEETKQKVWRKIIENKIRNQAQILLNNGFKTEYDMLINYANDVQDGDITNREGHAANVYFNCMMPEGTTRRSGGFVNACLNYGYAVLLSAFNREIVASGYLTQLGIWHDNEFNQFNLSCNMMEPLRTVVDETAYLLYEDDDKFKKKMANVLNYICTVDGKNTTLDVAIRQYTRSVLGAMEQGDTELITFPIEIKVVVDEQ